MKKFNDLHTDCKFRIFFSLNLLVVLFVGMGVSIKAQVGEISGPAIVCSSSAQYSLSVPPGCTVVWYASDNVQETSLPYSNPATFSSTGNGVGTIEAHVYDNMDSRIAIRYKSLWSGIPEAPWAVSSETAVYGYAGNWYGFAVWPPNQYQQAVPVLHGGDDVYYYGNDYFRLYFGYSGLYQVWATYENTCGESGSTYLIYGGPYEGPEYGFEVLQ
jgi:hypothetical protein